MSATSCVIRALTAHPMSISARVGATSTRAATPAGPGPNVARSLSGRRCSVTVSRFRGTGGRSGLCLLRLARKRVSCLDLGPGVDGVGRGSRAGLKSFSSGAVESWDAPESGGDDGLEEDSELEVEAEARGFTG